MSLWKKTVKLFLNPTAFIRDSWLFKYSSTESERPTKNLFVISHLGQLAQIEALIRKEKFLNCVLVIIYTKRNTQMPNLVRKSADKELFNRVLLLQIASFPNKIHLKSWIWILNSYKKLLKDIRPHRLFILSFERHYCLLAEEAVRSKIKVNLIEEGTATYKYSTLAEAESAQYQNINSAQNRAKFWIKHNPFFTELKPALGIFNQFHTVYAAFPEMLVNLFQPKEFKSFFLYENLAESEPDMSLIRRYPISHSDAVFLNQRYPFPQEEYTQSLILYLKNYSAEKIYIKLHPKDPESLKQQLRIEISNQNAEDKIILIDQYDFLVEGLIAHTQPKAVLALTSTGLVYTPKISSNSASISIYPTIRTNLVEKIGYSESIFKEADEHFEILKKFNVAQEK